MSITGIVVRRRVADLDATVSFYEQLTEQQGHRFAFSGADLAAVGPFLLFSASDEVGNRLAHVSATLTVDDLDSTKDTLVRLGAEIGAAPEATPNGRRMIARHPDGAVFEYVGR